MEINSLRLPRNSFFFFFFLPQKLRVSTPNSQLPSSQPKQQTVSHLPSSKLNFSGQLPSRAPLMAHMLVLDVYVFTEQCIYPRRHIQMIKFQFYSYHLFNHLPGIWRRGTMEDWVTDGQRRGLSQLMRWSWRELVAPYFTQFWPSCLGLVAFILSSLSSWLPS